jgi:AraC family transcriptional regulator of adaptative response / DNA-3-methyladenine glycosylase II
LLDDTDLTIADVAFASGFGSLRQFNRAVREVFRSTPRELRDRRRRTDRLVADGGLVLRMPFTPPYDWPAMLALLAEHAIPGVESVEGDVYRRTIALDGEPGLLEIGAGGVDHLLLRAHLPYWEGVIHVVERAARLVGLDVEPALAAAQLAGEPVIGPLIQQRPGLRVPGTWGPFETAVQAVVEDLATTPATWSTPAAAWTTPAGPPAARTMPARVVEDFATPSALSTPTPEPRAFLAELVATHGTPVPGLGHGLTHGFPSAEALAAGQYGGSVAGDVVVQLSKEVAAGNINLIADDHLVTSLTAVPGVSRPAAQYIALRLGARDAAPIDHEASENWRPWRSLATVHLVAAARTRT